MGYSPLRAAQSKYLVNSVVNNENMSSEDVASTLINAKEIAPNNCEALFKLGVHYYNLALYRNGEKIKPGEFPDNSKIVMAINEFQEIMETCEGLGYEFTAQLSMARSYYISGDPERAISILNNLIKKLPPKSSLHSEIYLLMAACYHKLDDLRNEFDSLLLSLYHKTDIEDSATIISGINQYIRDDPYLVEQLRPTRLLGVGRYTTAVLSDNGNVRMFALANDGLSMGRFEIADSIWVMKDYLMVAEQVIGSVDVDKNQQTHAAFASEDRLYYVANMDDIPNTIIPLNLNDRWWLTKYPSNVVSARATSLQLAVDEFDQAHIIWSLDVIGLVYEKIIDGSVNSTEYIMPYGKNPDIKATGEKVFVVCNTDSRSMGAFPSKGSQVLFREKIGESWNPIIQLSSDNVWSGGALLEVASDGTIHVVYISGGSNEDAKLMYKFRNLQGIWSNAEAIAEGEFRPWIPENYGGRYTVSTTLMTDGSLVVIWRAPYNSDFTIILGRRLYQGKWGQTSIIGIINGQDASESPSIVETPNLPDNTIKLIWFDNGQPVLYDWTP